MIPAERSFPRFDRVRNRHPFTQQVINYVSNIPQSLEKQPLRVIRTTWVLVYIIQDTRRRIVDNGRAFPVQFNGLLAGSVGVNVRIGLEDPDAVFQVINGQRRGDSRQSGQEREDQ